MLLQLFLLVFFASYAKSECMVNSDKEFEGSCFTFYSQQLNFTDARNWCHNKNPAGPSYLAYVPDQITANFLATRASHEYGLGFGRFWIGLSRNSSTSPYAWDNGKPVTYTNFGTTELDQNYIFEDMGTSRWGSYKNSSLTWFVCSYAATPAPTISPEDNSCKPGKKVTLLFAYSNDFDSATVRSTWYQGFLTFTDDYAGYAIVRFDVNTGQEGIAYFTDLDNATSYVFSHLPDSNLRFGDNTTGSDSLEIIEKFYNNNSKQYSVCGSRCVILEKRYSNRLDISKTVSTVRKHYGMVHAFSSVDPSGGTQSKAIYNLTSKTNGVCNFGKDSKFADFTEEYQFFSAPYPMYCANPVVSGQNTAVLPSMNVNTECFLYWTLVTVQDHGPPDSFQSFDLKWSNEKSGGDDWYISSKSLFGVHGDQSYYFDLGSYSMQLQYNYTSAVEQTIQVRVYMNSAPKDWLPYCD